MLMTKVLLICVLLVGILNIMGWEKNNYKKLNYLIMWVICIIQILTRLLEG